MKIYVGRWDLLPVEWEGYNGLCEKSEEEINAETKRQQEFLLQDTGYEDDFVGSYFLDEFEDTFNQCLTDFINSKEYWIKIF